MIVAMSLHAFLDESRRGSTYLIAVVTVQPRDLDRLRTAIRRMVKPGQRRLHFAKESNTRRGEVVSRLHALGVRARIWLCTHHDDIIARRVCLAAAATHLLDVGASRLALESCQHQDGRDRHTLAAVAAKAPDFSYEHLKPHEDPLLWASDAIAWCYGADAGWRRRVRDLVAAVHRLDVP